MSCRYVCLVQILSNFRRDHRCDQRVVNIIGIRQIAPSTDGTTDIAANFSYFFLPSSNGDNGAEVAMIKKGCDETA